MIVKEVSKSYKLTCAPVLALPEGAEGYVIYYDASKVGLGSVLMQHDKGNWEGMKKITQLITLS